MAELDKSGNNKIIFLSWLSNRVTEAKKQEFLLCYSQIDLFCLKREILKQPLLETITIDEVDKVFTTVYNNRTFLYLYRREMDKYKEAVSYYVSYVKELPVLPQKQETIEAEAPEMPGSIDAEALLETALKNECGKNAFGATAVFLSTTVNGLKTSDVKRILDRVPWAKQMNGRYFSFGVFTMGVSMLFSLQFLQA